MKHFVAAVLLGISVVDLSGCAGLAKKGLKGGPVQFSNSGPGRVRGPKGSSSCKNDIPQILPAFTKVGKPISYGGNTYEDLAKKWWIWQFSFNNTVNPFGNVSRYAYLLQPRGIFFLAGCWSTASSLYLEIPKDITIFFPLAAHLHWYNPPGTDDVIATEKTAIFFGTNISTFSLANISSFEARELVLANMTNTTLTLDVDGCKLDPYQNALIATSPGEEFTLPVVFSSDNDVLQGNFDAAQAGYYALLAPFKKIGKHTVHFSVSVTRSGPAAAAATLGLLPSFTFNEDITYYLNVV